MEEMSFLNMPVQRLKVAILPLDLPCSGPVTHSGENLITGKSHGKKPDRSRDRLPRVMKYYSPTGRRNHGRPSKKFWIRETGTGQQVAQLHDRYMMLMMMMMNILIKLSAIKYHYLFNKYVIINYTGWTFEESTPNLDKLLEYTISWIQHVNRKPRNRLPRVMKHYCPTGRRKRGKPLKRLLDTWDRSWSTSGPTVWQIWCCCCCWWWWWWWWWWWVFSWNFQLLNIIIYSTNTSLQLHRVDVRRIYTNFGQITGIHEKLDTNM